MKIGDVVYVVNNSEMSPMTIYAIDEITKQVSTQWFEGEYLYYGLFSKEILRVKENKDCSDLMKK